MKKDRSNYFLNTLFILAVLFLQIACQEDQSAQEQGTDSTTQVISPDQVEDHGEEQAGDQSESNEENIKKLRCKQSLVTPFGLYGVKYAIEEKLELCPRIENSCCTVTDQIVIYENYQSMREKDTLKEKHELIEKIYSDFFDRAREVSHAAERLLKKYHFKKVSNCKVLATKIMKFDIKNVSYIIKAALSEMHHFMQKSYDGFYCVLCDQNNQEFFDLIRSEVRFSQHFCRDMVAHSIHPLMYFSIYFIKYANLIMQFASVCNYQDHFAERPVDPHRLLITFKPHVEIIESCRNNINRVNWLEKCEPLCRKFNLLRYNPFFYPQLDEYRKATYLLDELMIKFNSKRMFGQIFIPIKNSEKNTGSIQYNIVKENEMEDMINMQIRLYELDQKHVINIGNRFASDEVIHSSIGTDSELFLFESVFTYKRGIHSQLAGKFTRMSDKIYETLLILPENLEDNRSRFFENANSEDLDENSTFFGKLVKKVTSVVKNESEESKMKKSKNEKTKKSPSGYQSPSSGSGHRELHGSIASSFSIQAYVSMFLLFKLFV